jgi:tRNA 2-thiouridine synthesizing protein A
MTEIDARGLSCPQPALLAQRAVEAGQLPAVVLVDTQTQVENIRRVAQRAGLRVAVENKGDEYALTVTR